MVLVLLFLLGCWSQRGAVTQSVRNCNPHFLFIHIKVNDPHTLTACRDLNKAAQAQHARQ